MNNSRNFGVYVAEAVTPSLQVTVTVIDGFPNPRIMHFAVPVALFGAMAPILTVLVFPDGEKIKPPVIVKVAVQFVALPFPELVIVAVAPIPPAILTASSGCAILPSSTV